MHMCTESSADHDQRFSKPSVLDTRPAIQVSYSTVIRLNNIQTSRDGQLNIGVLDNLKGFERLKLLLGSSDGKKNNLYVGGL